MSAINIVNFPNGVRVPGVYVGIDPSLANTYQINQNTLIIGQVAEQGATAPPNVPFVATTLAAVQAQCGGANTQLSRMYARYRELDSFGTVWLLPVQDDIDAIQGSTTLTITGQPSQPGLISLYVGGQLVATRVGIGDSPSIVAAAIAASCGLVPTLAATASNTAGVVTLTNVNGNAIAVDVRLNYQGAVAGEAIPPGLSIAIAAGATPSMDPLFAPAMANLGDTPYDFICCPYSGQTQTYFVEDLLNDQTGRWSWQSELFGMAFSAKVGSYGDLATFGASNNSQHVSFLGVADSPTPQDEIAALYTAACANSLRGSAALPLTQIPLNFRAPPVASRFTISERQMLLYEGLSTFTVDQAGTPTLERAVTTSQTIGGVPSDAYLDVETMATLMAVIRPIRSALQLKFARAILVADGTRISAGSNMVTSQTVLGEVIAQYAQLAQQGLVQNVATFAQNAYAQNAGNGQVSIYAPLDLANQLRIVALAVQFRKS